MFLPYFFIQNLVDLLVVTRGTDLVSLEVRCCFIVMCRYVA